MNRWAIIPLVVTAATVAGCQSERFRSQPLGAVDYTEAFRAGRTVFAQYFSIASADAESGKIVSRAKGVEAAPDRLLGSSPARKRAEMRIRRKGKEVIADIRVEIQREDVAAFRQMQPVTVDTELPSRTPAQEAAAVSAEQNQAWQTTGRDHELERTILADLLRTIAKGK